MWVSGNLIITNQPATITVAIVKNGDSLVLYGQMPVFTDTNNRAFPFSLNAYLGDVDKDDYFEVWYSSNTTNKNIYIQNLTWFTDSR